MCFNHHFDCNVIATPAILSIIRATPDICNPSLVAGKWNDMFEIIENS